MAQWREFTVTSQSNLEEILLAVGFDVADPATMDAIWDLPENVARRPAASAARFAVSQGQVVVVPIRDVCDVAVAASPDAPTPSTVSPGTWLVVGEKAFKDRLDIFGELLARKLTPEDAYRSSFSPLLLMKDSEVCLVFGAAYCGAGEDVAMRFITWLYNGHFVAPVLIADMSAVDVTGPPAEDAKSGGHFWANYPGELSAAASFFLRGAYIQRVGALVKPEWAAAETDAALTDALVAKYKPEEITSMFEEVAAKRQNIKLGVRGYGYIQAIVIAVIWARADLARGDYGTAAEKGATLIGGTFLFNMIVYARDKTPAELMTRYPGQYGKWLRGAGRTNARFNRFIRGPWLMAFSLATQDSPESLPPVLPRTPTEAEEIEKVRLALSIPSDAYIDRHGHAKKRSYLQVDPQDIGHVGGEFDQETEEILWWLGVDITYHRGESKWTVPGRTWWK